MHVCVCWGGWGAQNCVCVIGRWGGGDEGEKMDQAMRRIEDIASPLLFCTLICCFLFYSANPSPVMHVFVVCMG